MDKNRKEHWMEDEALLDRYLRGEIGGRERAELDAHLRECAACSDRMSQEQAMIAGIRSFGRKQLKTDFQAMLAARSAERSARYRWLGAAAAVILAVAVWYIPGEEPSLPIANEAPSSPRKEIPMKDEEKAVNNLAEGSAAARPVAREDEHVPSPREEPMAALQDVAAGASLPEVDEDKDAMRLQGAEKVQDIRSVMEVPQREVAWAVAIEVSEPTEAAGRAREKNDMYMQAEAAAKKETRKGPSVSQARPEITLSQRMFDLAEPRMQSLTREVKGRIPVQIVTTQDSMHLTLYPSVLWKNETFGSAYAADLGRDSILVRVGSQEFHIAREQVPVTK